MCVCVFSSPPRPVHIFPLPNQIKQTIQYDNTHTTQHKHNNLYLSISHTTHNTQHTTHNNTTTQQQQQQQQHHTTPHHNNINTTSTSTSTSAIIPTTQQKRPIRSSKDPNGVWRTLFRISKSCRTIQTAVLGAQVLVVPIAHCEFN